MYNVFHDVNSTLNTVTKIHEKGVFLIKVFKVFHSVNLTLFTKRARNSEKLGNNLEDDRRSKSQKKFISNLYVSKVMHISLKSFMLF